MVVGREIVRMQRSFGVIYGKTDLGRQSGKARGHHEELED